LLDSLLQEMDPDWMLDNDLSENEEH